MWYVNLSGLMIEGTFRPLVSPGSPSPIQLPGKMGRWGSTAMPGKPHRTVSDTGENTRFVVGRGCGRSDGHKLTSPIPPFHNPFMHRSLWSMDERKRAVSPRSAWSLSEKATTRKQPGTNRTMVRKLVFFLTGCTPVPNFGDGRKLSLSFVTG